jgi:hypothetical protein
MFLHFLLLFVVKETFEYLDWVLLPIGEGTLQLLLLVDKDLLVLDLEFLAHELKLLLLLHEHLLLLAIGVSHLLVVMCAIGHGSHRILLDHLNQLGLLLLLIKFGQPAGMWLQPTLRYLMVGLLLLHELGIEPVGQQWVTHLLERVHGNLSLQVGLLLLKLVRDGFDPEVDQV